ncbi:MAG: hypothetical protein AAFS00_01610, partial [Bacteroidota bacterium]
QHFGAILQLDQGFLPDAGGIQVATIALAVPFDDINSRAALLNLAVHEIFANRVAQTRINPFFNRADLLIKNARHIFDQLEGSFRHDFELGIRPITRSDVFLGL